MKKPDCHTDKNLILFCSGDLPKDEMQVVAAHLSACSDCNRYVTSVNAVLDLLPSDKVSLSEIEMNRFAAQVVQKATQRKFSVNFQFWGAAATTVAAGFLAVLIFNPGNLPFEKSSQVPTRLAELDLVENLEMLEDMDLLENLELLELLEGKG